jgi:Cys-tRNA synthase (O-phospho-L-seryl-tRNA:Cys-tRNA synthase)
VFVACLYVLIQILKCRNTATYSKEDVEYSTCIIFGQVVMGLMAGFGRVTDTCSSYYNDLSK